MALLCEKFCLTELRAVQGQGVRPGLRDNVDDEELEGEEEEEEED